MAVAGTLAGVLKQGDSTANVATHIDGPICIAMKTTLDISDALLRDARKLAARERTTLRAVVERGLRQVISESRKRKPFKLRDGSFGGRGLRPELRDASWGEIRDLIYEGRGA